ncbi:MAG: sensor histidine kinase, partial [Halobaculum sp.]
MSGGARRIDPERVPSYFRGLAVVLVGVMVVEATNQLLSLWPLTTASWMGVTLAYAVSFGVTLPFVAVVGYGGWVLAREPFPVERNRRIFQWSLAATVVWVAINLLTAVSLGFTTFWSLVGFVRAAVGFGAAFGLIVGVLEARAITNAVAAERTRREATDAQRDLLQYLNTILRHEVLNSATVIEGYAARIHRRASDDIADDVTVIRNRAEDLTAVTDDVRELLQALDGRGELRERNLTAILRAELDALDEEYDGVDTALDAPESVPVRTDELCGRLFSNLFTNAVVHDDGTPSVTVSVTVADETVRVKVADDGPGIPESDRRTLFEYTGKEGTDHGLGLSVVATLARRYAGSVELQSTGPDGSVFTVSLPRADHAPDTPCPTLSVERPDSSP